MEKWCQNWQYLASLSRESLLQHEQTLSWTLMVPLSVITLHALTSSSGIVCVMRTNGMSQDTNLSINMSISVIPLSVELIT